MLSIFLDSCVPTDISKQIIMSCNLHCPSSINSQKSANTQANVLKFTIKFYYFTMSQALGITYKTQKSGN